MTQAVEILLEIGRFRMSGRRRLVMERIVVCSIGCGLPALPVARDFSDLARVCNSTQAAAGTLQGNHVFEEVEALVLAQLLAPLRVAAGGALLVSVQPDSRFWRADPICAPDVWRKRLEALRELGNEAQHTVHAELMPQDPSLIETIGEMARQGSDWPNFSGPGFPAPGKFSQSGNCPAASISRDRVLEKEISLSRLPRGAEVRPAFWDDAYVQEKLANRRLLKEELAAGHTPMAKRFAVLFSEKPDRARELLGLAVSLPAKDGRQPNERAYLNVRLKDEGVRYA